MSENVKKITPKVGLFKPKESPFHGPLPRLFRQITRRSNQRYTS